MALLKKVVELEQKIGEEGHGKKKRTEGGKKK